MLDPGNKELRQTRVERRALWPRHIRVLRWWGGLSILVFTFGALIGGYKLLYATITIGNMSFGCWSPQVPHFSWRFVLSVGAILLCAGGAILTFVRPWGIWLWILGLPLISFCEWLGPPPNTWNGLVPGLSASFRYAWSQSGPAQVVVFAALIFTLVAWIHLATYDDPLHPSRCMHCGYSRIGINPDRFDCPECGQPFGPPIERGIDHPKHGC